MKNKLFVFMLIVMIAGGVSFGVVNSAHAQVYPDGYYNQNYGQNACVYVGSEAGLSTVQYFEAQYPQLPVNSVLALVATNEASRLTTSGFYPDSSQDLAYQLYNASIQLDANTTGYAYTYSNVGEVIMAYPQASCGSYSVFDPNPVSPINSQSTSGIVTNSGEIGVATTDGTYNGQNVLYVVEIFGNQSASPQQPYSGNYPYGYPGQSGYIGPQPGYIQPITLSQSSVSVDVAYTQSVTVYGGNGSSEVSNTDPSVASFSTSGNTLTVTGQSAGTAVLTVCPGYYSNGQYYSNGYYDNGSGCATLTVTVSNFVNQVHQYHRPWWETFFPNMFGGGYNGSSRNY